MSVAKTSTSVDVHCPLDYITPAVHGCPSTLFNTALNTKDVFSSVIYTPNHGKIRPQFKNILINKSNHKLHKM